MKTTICLPSPPALPTWCHAGCWVGEVFVLVGFVCFSLDIYCEGPWGDQGTARRGWVRSRPCFSRCAPLRACRPSWCRLHREVLLLSPPLGMDVNKLVPLQLLEEGRWGARERSEG